MNTRQKAKHFKKLYEATLPGKPTSIIFTRNPLKRYKCKVIVPKITAPEESTKEAIHIMAQHFEKLASEHIEYNKELGQYELTLWLKGKSE